jgi:hypothetical protein
MALDNNLCPLATSLGYLVIEFNILELELGRLMIACICYHPLQVQGSSGGSRLRSMMRKSRSDAGNRDADAAFFYF